MGILILAGSPYQLLGNCHISHDLSVKSLVKQTT
jgi:hypothetical protein